MGLLMSTNTSGRYAWLSVPRHGRPMQLLASASSGRGVLKSPPSMHTVVCAHTHCAPLTCSQGLTLPAGWPSLPAACQPGRCCSGTCRMVSRGASCCQVSASSTLQMLVRDQQVLPYLAHKHTALYCSADSMQHTQMGPPARNLFAHTCSEGQTLCSRCPCPAEIPHILRSICQAPGSPQLFGIVPVIELLPTDLQLVQRGCGGRAVRMLNTGGMS